MSSEQIWYVAYGSNLLRARLLAYLQGGKPPGADVVHPGARDATPPAVDVAVDLPGRIYFAGKIAVWGGGGVAFYDPEIPGLTAGRAYRITAEQFEDLRAQENASGPRRYERLIEVGEHEGLPMLTFTARHGIDDVLEVLPSEAYAGVIIAGLQESRGWSAEEARAYVEERSPVGRTGRAL